MGEHISLKVRVSPVGKSLGICVSQVRKHISLGIRVSQVGEHTSLEVSVSQVGEHISLGIFVFQVGNTYHEGYVFPRWGTHITRDKCLLGGGTDITNEYVFSR